MQPILLLLLLVHKYWINAKMLYDSFFLSFTHTRTQIISILIKIFFIINMHRNLNLLSNNNNYLMIIWQVKDRATMNWSSNIKILKYRALPRHAHFWFFFRSLHTVRLVVGGGLMLLFSLMVMESERKFPWQGNNNNFLTWRVAFLMKW